MNVLVLHDTCTELVSYCISCCLVHQLSSLSGMLSTINRVSSKTEHTVIAKCPLVNTTLRYLRQDLHSLVQQLLSLKYAKPTLATKKTLLLAYVLCTFGYQCHSSSSSST